MEDFKSILLGTIQEFKDKKADPIDWTIAWEDEEKFETIIDGLDALIDGIALIPDIEETKRIHLLGKLALNRSHLSHCYGNEHQIPHFIKHGQILENLLREVLAASPWLKTAHDRVDEYIEFEETVTEETQLTQKQLDHFRPILMALAAMAIITIEQEDAHEEPNDDFEFEEEDDDEENCDEYCD